MRTNAEFHDAILAASHSRVLTDQLSRARLLIAWHRYCATYRPGRMASSIPEHQAIMDAICQGDSDHAADLMSKHVNMLGDNLGDVVNFLERMKADADNKSQSTITYGIVTLPDATQA